ncbi:MAG: 30S ribosomal protein S13 [Candidatus Spechtbacterales bacterium]
MPRISGVDIPENKQILIALTYIHGIGRTLSGKILEQVKIDKNTKTKDLTPEQVNMLRTVVSENHLVEGDLRRESRENIKRLKDISAYRGSRHERHLPTRGQRTKRNSRTVRGNKRSTVGSGRRPPASHK